MVARFTLGRTRYQESWPHIEPLLAESEGLRRTLLQAADDDAHAYGEVTAAMRLPRATGSQRRERRGALQAALRGAAAVPLETARAARRALDLAATAAEYGNPNLVSDAGVAAALTEAALQSAALNVRINLAYIRDQDFVATTDAALTELLSGAGAGPRHRAHAGAGGNRRVVMAVLTPGPSPRVERGAPGEQRSRESVMPPVLHATFSIAAYDPGTQSWGVATQSKCLAVGAVVPWARAGVGAVATQSRVNVGYGPASLELLAQDRTPEDVLAQTTAADPRRAWRQIGIVDRHGRAANYTGAKCFPWAGARAGEGYTCQGNMLASADVLAALAETFEHARDRGDDDLAEWLVAALAAAQAAGGDRRGQQSAALLVVRAQGGPEGRNDRAIDLRVDDHPAPITALPPSTGPTPRAGRAARPPAAQLAITGHAPPNGGIAAGVGLSAPLPAAVRQPFRSPSCCTRWLAMQPTKSYPNTWTCRRSRLPRRC